MVYEVQSSPVIKALVIEDYYLNRSRRNTIVLASQLSYFVVCIAE